MRNKLKIYLAKPSPKIPNRFFTEGKVWFDLPIGFDLAETLTPEKLDTLQSLQANFAVSSALSKSEKNRFIFSAYGDSKIDVLMLAGSRVLEFKQLIYVKESTQGFEVSFISDNPLVKIKDAKIKDLDLGVFDYSIPNMLLSFANDLTDPAKVAYFPVCDYGAWHDAALTDKSVFPQDLRPFFKEYELIKRIFCQFTGYRFESELHEKGTVYGAYILANQFNGVEFGAKAVLGADFNYTEQDAFSNAAPQLPPFFDNITATASYTNENANESGYDNGLTINGYYHNNRIFSDISGKYKIIVNLWLKNNIQDVSVNNYGYDVRIFVNGVQIEDIEFRIRTIGNFENYKISSKDFNVINGDIVSVRFFPVNATFTTVPNALFDYDITIGTASFIELVAVSVQPSAAYVERLNKFVNGSIKCVDLLKGTAHGVDGSFSFDHVNRVVRLLPQSTVENLHGTNENMQGYYNNNQVDLRPLIICDSEDIEQIDSELTRIQTWRYKESSDPFLSKDKYFGAYTTDLGDAYKDGETESENPFFEPTATRQDHPLFKGVSTYPIAVLRDNEDGRRSFAIAPRRVILQNGTPFGANGISNYWSFFGTMQQNSMPVCYMLPTIPYNGVQTYANVMYGGARYSIFEMFYKKWLNQQKNGIKINLLVWLNSSMFQKIDLRNSYILNIKGKPIVAHIQEVSDHKITSQLPTPITFTPIKIDYSC